MLLPLSLVGAIVCPRHKELLATIVLLGQLLHLPKVIVVVLQKGRLFAQFDELYLFANRNRNYFIFVPSTEFRASIVDVELARMSVKHYLGSVFPSPRGNQHGARMFRPLNQMFSLQGTSNVLLGSRNQLMRRPCSPEEMTEIPFGDVMV
ncbi:hypothetical protein EAI_07713 [Harpegnathos saltator]|uniref:Uncharacterized protein n=1 Tax=Harpegnathos saltator TaxID=610380 RepID=E2B502_HARSA|nr:hypothetical protein EAI_07713 [Harpegnathos saltator]